MSKDDVVVQAFEKMAPLYEEVVDDELNRFWGWSYSRFVNKMLAMTPISENSLILDVATGTGMIPFRLTKENGNSCRIVGLDITYAMLENAKKKLNNGNTPISFTCASAMDLPFRRCVFDVITCGLAAHHMDVSQLLSEMKRVLNPDGTITIADVGGSPLFRHPVIQALLRVGTFIYFLLSQGRARASAEARALPNLRTAGEWKDLLLKYGFTDILISNLPSKYSWIPAPLVMRARSIGTEVSNVDSD
jgi:ubiquinone/menaquinone biosynthesis C-methylase UbiE